MDKIKTLERDKEKTKLIYFIIILEIETRIFKLFVILNYNISTYEKYNRARSQLAHIISYKIYNCIMDILVIR